MNDEYQKAVLTGREVLVEGLGIASREPQEFQHSLVAIRLVGDLPAVEID
jgi:hypothetical protein